MYGTEFSDVYRCILIVAEIERKYNLIFWNIIDTFKLLYILYVEMGYKIYNWWKKKISMFRLIMSYRTFRLFKSRNVFRLLRKI